MKNINTEKAVKGPIQYNMQYNSLTTRKYACC